MRSHSTFSEHVAAIGGADQAARYAVIDTYDAKRKTVGRAAALEWLEREAKKYADPVFQVLQSVQDKAARRILERALNSQNESKLKWLRGRLTTEMIGDAAAHVGLTEDKIRAQEVIPLKRRRLRFKVKQSISMINLAVGATGGRYGHELATPFEMSMRQRQKELQEKWAKETWAYHRETQEMICMYDLLKKAGEGRVAEVLTFAKGIQDFGESQGLVPMAYTLTAPPSMHPNPVKGRNSWDGTSPRQAQAWIHARHRAAYQIMRDEDIYPAGLRTVEGQLDETPHWHCVAWIEPGQERRFEQILRGVAPSWKSEIGANIKNMNDEPEDFDEDGNKKRKATAVSYMFKYILKSIGGIGDDEKLDYDLAESIKRQECWRAKHGIRGYQDFGMPSKQSWRTFRAVEKPPRDRLLNSAWSAVKEGNGESFIKISGGLNLKRMDRPIDARVIKETIDKDGEFEIVKYARLTNKLNGVEIEAKLKVWELIDNEQKAFIEEQLTVIQNPPSNPPPDDADEYFSDENRHVIEPNAPPMVLWNGESYPR